MIDLNDRAFFGLRYPAVPIGAQLLHICCAVGVEPLKLHVFFPNNKISEKEGTFGGLFKRSTCAHALYVVFAMEIRYRISL